MKKIDEFPRAIFPLSDSLMSHFTKFYENKELREQLSKKKYSIKVNTEATYRIINHWESIGLIDNTRENEGDWRKFSICDLVWQQIIMTLRNFGFSNEKIAIVKKCLFMHNGKSGENYPLFDYYVATAFARERVFLIVEEDGNANIGEHKRIKLQEESGVFNEHHLKISLNKIIQKFRPEKDMSAKVDISVSLNPEELAVVDALCSKKYESIKVKSKNGKAYLLEKTENIDPKTELKSIKKENQFQSISHEEENGKIVSIKRTAKEKL